MATRVNGRIFNIFSPVDYLEYRPPQWADVAPDVSGSICWQHNEICEVVEEDMLHLRRKLWTQTPEEVAAEDHEIDSRRRIQNQMRRRKIQIYEENQKSESMIKDKGKKRKYEETALSYPNHGDEQTKKLYQPLPPPSPTSLINMWNEPSSANNPTWTFKQGTKYNLSQLLTTSTRSFLINNRGTKVDIGVLNQKHTVLYFWNLPLSGGDRFKIAVQDFDADLKEIYKMQETSLEVVFVALGHYKKLFDYYFSSMPWLAIPHDDQEGRDFFKKEFSIPCPTCVRALLFAPDGTLVVSNLKVMVSAYGISAFPYTSDKTHAFDDEWIAIQNQLFMQKQIPPLTKLLGSHVISWDGSKVPTADLEGKIVGLYFFKPASDEFSWATELVRVWKSLTIEQRSAFAIIFINKHCYNLSNAKAEFEEKLGLAVPWYSVALCGRKLSHIFNKADARSGTKSDLIILQRDKYQHMSYFGFHILMEYGRDAYPFTLEKVVAIERKEQQKELVLGKLLSFDAPLRRGGYPNCGHECHVDVTLSDLIGRRVILLFATASSLQTRFTSLLKQVYYAGHWPCHIGMPWEFEVIYVSLDCGEYNCGKSIPFFNSIKEVPWLIHAFVPCFGAALAHEVFGIYPPHLPAIAVFGPDGHLETKLSNLGFEDHRGNLESLLRGEDYMDEEFHKEVVDRYQWDLDNVIAFDIFCKD